MPKRKRVQREHTEDWPTIQQYTLWPEQTAYELLHPVVQIARSSYSTGERDMRATPYPGAQSRHF